tara:strand:- start:48 stop:233 length:186 start_codon:yes stop_codon:yes gene_type:complete
MHAVIRKLRVLHQSFIDNKFSFDQIIEIRDEIIEDHFEDVIDRDEAYDESDKFFYDRQFWK